MKMDDRSRKISETKKEKHSKELFKAYKEHGVDIIDYIPSDRQTGSKSKVIFICKKCKKESEVIHKPRREFSPYCSSCLRSIKAKERIKNNPHLIPNRGDLITLEEVKQSFFDKGVTPLFAEYNNPDEKLDYICACGNLAQITYRRVKYEDAKIRCRECYLKEASERERNRKHKKKYSVEDVKQKIINHGAEPLFEDIEEGKRGIARSRLHYKCQCGKEFHTTLEMLNKREKEDENFILTCRSCVTKKSDRLKNIQEEMNERVFEFFKSRGLIPLFKKYKNNSQKLRFICKCGNEGVTTWGSIYINSYEPKCRECQLAERPRGENHPKWNPDLSDSERERNRERSKNATYWNSLVLKYYNYTCQLSQQVGGQLAIHHLNSWSNHPEERFYLFNGIPIKKELHDQYHSSTPERHKGNNTRKDFEEFFNVKLDIPENVLVEIIFPGSNLESLYSKKKYLHLNNINYLPFYSDEISIKLNIVVDVINKNLKKSMNRYDAKDLELKEITDKKYKIFLENNHILGSTDSLINLGLFAEDDLISVMTFGPARFDNIVDIWELHRYCSLLNTEVERGYEKLFEYFVDMYKPKTIKSYENLRFHDLSIEENIHTELGFKFDSMVFIDEVYSDGTRFYKDDFYYKKIFDDPQISLNEKMKAFDAMIEEGYSQLYDCGNNVFIWKNPNT